MNSNRKKVYSAKEKQQKLDEMVQYCHELEKNTQENYSDSSLGNSDSEHNLNDFDKSNLNSDSESNNESVLRNDDLVNNDTSDKEVVCEATGIKDLQKWIDSNNVPLAQVEGLFKILKQSILPLLSKTSKTLLKRKVDSNPEIQKQIQIGVKRKKLLVETKTLQTKVLDISADSNDSQCIQVNENLRSDMKKGTTVIDQVRKQPIKKIWLTPIASMKNSTSLNPVLSEKQIKIEDNEDDSEAALALQGTKHPLSLEPEPGTSNNEVNGSTSSTWYSKDNSSEIPIDILPRDPLSLQSQPTSTSEVHVSEDCSALMHNVLPANQLIEINCKSDFESAVLSHLVGLNELMVSIKEDQDKLAKDIDSIKVTQDTLSNFLLYKKETLKASSDISKKYNITIPIPTFEEFTAFENLLQSNNCFKNDVHLELRTLMDKDCVITKSIVKMLKKFLAKDLASQFTAVRSSSINKNKQKFKPTQFCTLIFGTITAVRYEKTIATASDDLDSALTDVLGNVFKWKA